MNNQVINCLDQEIKNTQQKIVELTNLLKAYRNAKKELVRKDMSPRSKRIYLDQKEELLNKIMGKKTMTIQEIVQAVKQEDHNLRKFKCDQDITSFIYQALTNSSKYKRINKKKPYLWKVK